MESNSIVNQRELIKQYISKKNDLQFYGIVFSHDFEVLLRIEDNKYKLTGGKPEENESYEETLKREYNEELIN